MLAGQDLYLAAPQVSVCRKTEVDNQHVMVFENGFSMTIGDNRLSSRSAVVWLESQGFAEPGFASQAYYQARVYLEEQVSVSRGNRSKTTPISQVVMEGGQSLVVRFLVTGQVFTTADAQAFLDCDRLYALPLYVRGVDASAGMSDGPVVPDSAMVPTIAPWDWTGRQSETPAATISAVELVDPNLPATAKSRPAVEPKMLYPVHISAVWDPIPTIEKMTLAGGQDVITISGRFYLWQRQSQDSLVEFQADSAVVFYQTGQFELSNQQDGRDIAQGRIESVYLRGNIVMNDSNRTIRADEIYYDFVNRQAVIVNASMRAFDEKRGLPIYLSAQRLRQAGASMFQAEKVTLTSSEFYMPQISANAARMVLTTEEAVEQRQSAAGGTDTAARSYDGTLYDVDVKYHDFAIFKWPKLRTNFVRPELPISKLRVSNDSDFGTAVETEWYLFRLLGLKEPAGMDTRLKADYFSERGPGGGVASEYEFDNSYGDFVGYVMYDKGKDDLGDINSRENLEPDTETRGRLSWRNRQFLPDDWQLTTEIGYLSDRNFMESLYRNEFYTDKDQETLIHLKQQRDNWALSLLGKVRINDFENTTEELPTVEYHRTGESLWNHSLTWYSDNRISRLRDRYDEDLTAAQRGSTDFYTFGSTRQEVDFPLLFGTLRVTPYVAGTYAYEDQDGYDLSLSGRDTGYNRNAMLGETGVRTSTMFWKEYSSFSSRLWDIDGIRHIAVPHAEAAAFGQTETGIDMRDVFNLGLSQRWQTHRGQGANRRQVDWLRWDVDTTFVSRNAEDDIGLPNTYGPSMFLFNNPSIPVFMRRNDQYFGMVRDSVNSSAEWKLSETTAILGDANYDIRSGNVQQLNAGVSRYVHPDMSLYLGSRYLRPIIVSSPEDDIYEQGSHSVVGAITYQLASRYWITVAEEYNFDFGRSVSTDVALVRQYHRLFYAMGFSIDQTLDRQSFSLSLWPQGVDELTLGERRYGSLVGMVREN